MKGPLKEPLRCWRKTEPYDLKKNLLVSAEWDDKLKWWNVSFLNGSCTVQTTTTDWPKIRKGGK